MTLGGRYLARLARGARAYTAAVLLNLALLNTTLVAPPRRPVVQVCVVATTGPFRPTELLTGPGGEPAGVLAVPLATDPVPATASLN
ncbi:MAG TPA: hypothetical protein VFW96_01625 [Thermomicrobiales bacterium]|nr:hypothetical protein [Thermomicrobiales bacterium]